MLGAGPRRLVARGAVEGGRYARSAWATSTA